MSRGAVALATLCLACGAPTQSASCQSYLKCAAALSAGDQGMLQSQYGPMGLCWSTDRETADSCTGVCESTLESLRSAHPQVGACR